MKYQFVSVLLATAIVASTAGVGTTVTVQAAEAVAAAETAVVVEAEAASEDVAAEAEIAAENENPTETESGAEAQTPIEVEPVSESESETVGETETTEETEAESESYTEAVSADAETVESDAASAAEDTDDVAAETIAEDASVVDVEVVETETAEIEAADEAVTEESDDAAAYGAARDSLDSTLQVVYDQLAEQIRQVAIGQQDVTRLYMDDELTQDQRVELYQLDCQTNQYMKSLIAALETDLADDLYWSAGNITYKTNPSYFVMNIEVSPAYSKTGASGTYETDTAKTSAHGKANAAPDRLGNYNGWKTYKGKDYWYENGVKQGTTGRGKEIYDPGTNAWYWLDAVQYGAKAVSKDVYQESNGGKWVRYDANGHMIKGWQTTSAGTYYFDPITGAMAKGKITIDGLPCWFNASTGVGMNRVWERVNGQDYYWYENGKRQGYEPGNKSYRGKEIYDSAKFAWFWLDNNAQGKKAVSKDVYQPYTIQGKDNIGKWVRYDANGRMIKGWQSTSAGRYYFDPTTGAMTKGSRTIDGKTYYFDPTTGICK